ncbi:peptidase S8 and S53 subtilisin kexin sedolisin [Fictibacillus macauensis ZFHKF-1]|uniref:Peptidase S8 and S53 subtilisin kexin sedolisin n=1 Tax=Fictibacillus macauensis ZFHKF-1 TaxID=1196324 RepID=I8AG41_9BACL|nr:S8 family serine peptidase [Fictibacillus macauensis]EIT84359.1 peptidase S8 and S53 subtilisin kexin sedolisin [Fictibacillus macauensis ZFHKF-1]
MNSLVKSIMVTTLSAVVMLPTTSLAQEDAKQGIDSNSMKNEMVEEASKDVDLNVIDEREIIVKPKAQHSVSLAKYDVQKKKTEPELADLGLSVVKVSPSKSYEATLHELQRDKAIEYAEPNYVRKEAGGVAARVNDPNFYRQYDLKQINWSSRYVPKSKPITVAVLDCGVIRNHPDLKGKILKGKDYIGTEMTCGHGTRVSGVIAATYNNGIGLSGMNNNVRILPIRASQATSFRSTTIAAGVRYAVKHGAKIINMSFAERKFSRTEADALSYAYNKGVILIASAGNHPNRPVEYPAAYPEVIAVAATQKGSKLSRSTHGKAIDLAAPGKDIFLTDKDRGYAVSSGTSYSAPLTSGLASILLSRHPSLTPPEVEYLMEKGGYIPKAYRTKSGLTHTYGYGEIDVAKAIKAKLPASLSNDVGDSKKRSKEIQLNTTYRNKYDLPGDHDVYKLKLPTSQKVKIEVSQASVMDPVINVNGKIYDRRGPGRNEVARLSLKAGTNYITITEGNSHWSPKSYTLTVK